MNSLDIDNWHNKCFILFVRFLMAVGLVLMVAMVAISASGTKGNLRKAALNLSGVPRSDVVDASAADFDRDGKTTKEEWEKFNKLNGF